MTRLLEFDHNLTLAKSKLIWNTYKKNETMKIIYSFGIYKRHRFTDISKYASHLKMTRLLEFDHNLTLAKSKLIWNTYKKNETMKIIYSFGILFILIITAKMKMTKF